MKFLKILVQNFGSYKHLEFNLSDRGLTLLQGATGSGKSTFLDMPTWVLFGITAKRGSVDNIKSWYANDEPTVGVLTLQKDSDLIEITRIRGKSAENDLYWIFNNSGNKTRGKDLKDSQSLLENLLGISSDLFLTASYFNESNRALTFFTDKINVRREFLQSILDVKLVEQLLQKIKIKRKDSENEVLQLQAKYNNLKGHLEANENHLTALKKYVKQFDEDQLSKIKDLTEKETNFEQTKTERLSIIEEKLKDFNFTQADKLKQLETEVFNIIQVLKPLSMICSACGSPNKEARLLEKQKFDLEMSINLHKNKVNPYVNLYSQEQEKQNNFSELIKQEKEKINPYNLQIISTESKIKSLFGECEDYQVSINKVKTYLNNLSQLQDILIQTRGLFFNLNIKQIQQDTNKFLDTYFDSIIKVELFVEKDDSIEVLIHKDSYQCDYSQLSKGQKGILKLCFATSVMLMAANNAGIHFNLLMFDESLDGLDAEMKIKAHSFFQHVSSNRSSTLVVDHSLELKSVFTEALTVINTGGYSTII